MHTATPALIVATIVTAGVWSGLLWQLWVLRREFEIAARAPVLVGICGTSTLVVVLAVLVHWTLLLESKGGLPCYVMLVATYLWYAVSVVPYCLRALRLVVAYNTHYRLKYARYVKKTVIRKLLGTTWIGIALAAVLVFFNMPERYSRHKHGCFFFQERQAIEIFLVLGLGPTIFAMFKLMQVHDVFGIGPESIRVIIPVQLAAVTQMTVQELLHARVLQDRSTVHFSMEMLVFVGLSNVLVWSVLLPVARYHGWIGAGKMVVLPVEESTCGSDSDKEGVYDYAHEGGEIAKIFGEFCRKNLCMESWDFIMDYVAYQELTNPEEQFTNFIRILDQYLQPASPQEVNVSGAMKKRLLKFQTRATFTGLHEVTRRTILEAPVREIVLMLEQNILAKFKLTPAVQQREQRRLLELEIQAAERVADGDKEMLALMTSVSIGKVASPRICADSTGENS